MQTREEEMKVQETLLSLHTQEPALGEQVVHAGGTLALILAAGEGTRMKSKHSKVSHKVLGKPMISWVAQAALGAGCDALGIVVGKGADELRAIFADKPLGLSPQFIFQAERRGTGHAVMVARDFIQAQNPERVVILSGDSPLISSESIEKLCAQQEESRAACTILSFVPESPFGYGRIVRDEAGAVCAIVEQKDCTEEQAQTTECNSGVYCFETPFLLDALLHLTTDNAQQEYYLTDAISQAFEQCRGVETYCVSDPKEAVGVNSRAQLAQANIYMQERVNALHMAQGVTIVDPRSTWIEDGVHIGADTIIMPGCYLQGDTSIGENCLIGPNTRLENTQVGDACVLDETIAKEAQIASQVSCGPRAYLRPGTKLDEGSKVGTSVEIKNSYLGKGSKVPHLSYIGDAHIGAEVNIGAGTITCNYDGQRKHRTSIGDGAFIGSDCMLVAPVEIGKGALVGAGSVITRAVPDNTLALERSEQRHLDKESRRPKK